MHRGIIESIMKINEVNIMPTNNPRFCITVSEEMLEEIDNYRFENRFNSRSQATVELIRMGIDALKAKKCDQTLKKN